MKLLLILEVHLCQKGDGKYYADRVVNKQFLDRYLQVFDEVYLCARTTKKDLKYQYDVNHKQVKIIPLPDFRGTKGLLKNIFKIKRIIKDAITNVDAIIYRAPTHLSLFTYKEVLKSKKPLAFEFMMAANKMIDGTGLIKNTLNSMIDAKAKKMCLSADGVSYVTENILQQSYPCKAILEPDNKEYFTESYSSIDLKEESFYLSKRRKIKEPIKIIHIGYMDSLRKGQDVLLKACKILKDKGYQYQLTLVGDGGQRTYFESLVNDLQIKEQVNFYGAVVDNEEKNNLLREHDLFVFPTQSEGLPRTIIEAMANSLCCIASSVDGIPELLEPEFLVQKITPEAFAEKMIEIIENREIIIKNGQRNYQHSLKYESSILQNKRKNFYQNLVNKVRRD